MAALKWRQLALIEKVGAIWHHAIMAEREPFPSDLAERFQVRMPAGLRERIREAADANQRSMNAEIISRLEASFAPVGLKAADKDESDAIALFASGLMQAMHYGKEIGRMVKVEVSVSDGLKPGADEK